MARRKQGKSWPDEIVAVVRECYRELYQNHAPINNDPAEYSIPTHWTKTGVTMWQAFVNAAGDGKEAAVATALLTDFLARGGWVELCKRVDEEVTRELVVEKEAELAAQAEEAVAELSQVKKGLLETGVILEEDGDA